MTRFLKPWHPPSKVTGQNNVIGLEPGFLRYTYKVTGQNNVETWTQVISWISVEYLNCLDYNIISNYFIFLNYNNTIWTLDFFPFKRWYQPALPWCPAINFNLISYMLRKKLFGKLHLKFWYYFGQNWKKMKVGRIFVTLLAPSTVNNMYRY